MQQVTDFIKAPKPKGFTGYHFAVMLCLMHEGQQSQLSHSTIGERTGMSRYTVRNVLQDFQSWKWISMSSGKRQYNTSVIEVQYVNLPVVEEQKPLIISKHASTLADYFKVFWLEHCHKYKNKRGWNCTRPLKKNWKTRWESVFQLRLDEGYTFNELATILNEHKATGKAAKTFIAGPQNRQLFPKKGVQ